MQCTSFSCCYMLLYYFIAVLALLDMSDVMHILMCGDLRLFFYDVWWLTLQWHVVFRHIGFIPTDFSVKNFHINYFDLNCQSDFNPSSCAAILMTFFYILLLDGFVKQVFVLRLNEIFWYGRWKHCSYINSDTWSYPRRRCSPTCATSRHSCW